MKAKFAIFGSALLIGLASAQALGAFGGGSPNLAAPGPLPTAVLAMLGVPWIVISLTVSGAFCLWCKQLFMQQTSVPIRTWVLFFCITAITIVWYVFGWQYGLKWEGKFFTYGCAAIAGLLLLTSGLLLYLAQRRNSFHASLAAHAMLFLCIVSYAFPWLGETP